MSKQSAVYSIVQECRSLCRQRGSKKYARDMDRYFKHVLPMHGLKSPQIKNIYKEVAQRVLIKKWSLDKIIEVGTELLSSEYFEEKGVGICFLKECSSRLNKDCIDQLAPKFKSFVFDWATCDGLASGVLRPALLSDMHIIESMIEWSSSENLWLRRASCVTFVTLAKSGEFNETIIKICSNAVQMDERFVQLGVGWLLREFGLADREQMFDFLRNHCHSISREGLRYALEKVPKPLRKEMMDYHKNENTKS